MGLVYFKDYGFTWTHAGGVPGYESIFTYNPCINMYVVLMYDVKPKQQFIFMNISQEIFKVLNQSQEVKRQIIEYQKNHKLPRFCQCSNLT